MLLGDQLQISVGRKFITRRAVGKYSLYNKMSKALHQWKQSGRGQINMSKDTKKELPQNCRATKDSSEKTKPKPKTTLPQPVRFCNSMTQSIMQCLFF
jgi:hypothetical protein